MIFPRYSKLRQLAGRGRGWRSITGLCQPQLAGALVRRVRRPFGVAPEVDFQTDALLWKDGARPDQLAASCFVMPISASTWSSKARFLPAMKRR